MCVFRNAVLDYLEDVGEVEGNLLFWHLVLHLLLFSHVCVQECRALCFDKQRKQRKQHKQ